MCTYIHEINMKIHLGPYKPVLTDTYFVPCLTIHMPIMMATGSKAWTVFAPSNTGPVGSKPIQGMDNCVYVYSVFVLSCVQVAALRRADHSSESNCLCNKDYETEEKDQGQQRAVEPLMDGWKITIHIY
jgi:hypothetical protein